MVQNIRLNSQWNVTATAILEGNPTNFVGPVVWTTANDSICDILSVAADQKSAVIRGRAIGSTTLTVTSSGVETVVTINVIAPFDSIALSFTQIA